MPVGNLFEEFQTVEQKPAPDPVEYDETLEDHRLQAFEKGYSAGWDDAVKAQTESGTYLSETLQQSLLGMQVSMEDVHRSVMSALKPFLAAIVDAVLPEIARESVALHVVELLSREIEKSVQSKLEIRATGRTLDLIRKKLSDLPESCVLLEDPSLMPEQAAVTVNTAESQIDLNEILAEIAQQIAALYTSEQEDPQNE